MDEMVRQASASLREMLGTAGLTDLERRQRAQDSEWLRILYGRFRADSQSNNDRVYTASRMYLPLSLAPLAALVAGVDDPNLWHVLFLGATSVGLMAMNVFTTDRERSSRQQYIAWMVAIQEEIGLDTSRIPSGVRSVKLATLSRSALALLLVAWIVLAFAVGTDQLDPGPLQVGQESAE